jgi:hypothetical protein
LVDGVAGAFTSDILEIAVTCALDRFDAPTSNAIANRLAFENAFIYLIILMFLIMIYFIDSLYSDTFSHRSHF